MQLIIDIKNEKITDKIIRLLEIFKNDGVVIKSISSDKENNLPEFDVDYERSFEYKLDRVEFEEMKENI